MQTAWAISRSENKVSLLNSVWEVKSFRRPSRAQNQAKLDLKTPKDHDLLNMISENEFLEVWC